MSEMFKVCRITRSTNRYVITMYVNAEPMSTTYSSIKPRVAYNPATKEYVVDVPQVFTTVVDRAEDESQ